MTYFYITRILLFQWALQEEVGFFLYTLLLVYDPFRAHSVKLGGVTVKCGLNVVITLYIVLLILFK